MIVARISQYKNKELIRMQSSTKQSRTEDRLAAFLSVLILKPLYQLEKLQTLWEPGCLLLVLVKSLSFQLCVTIKAKLQILVSYRKLNVY